jgi:hypothetical protein
VNTFAECSNVFDDLIGHLHGPTEYFTRNDALPQLRLEYRTCFGGTKL